MTSARLPALALIAVLAGASAAQAQEPPTTPAAMAHKAWDPAQMRARMEARRTARLKALHNVLAIRPDQEGAFAAFAASMRPPEVAPGARPGEMAPDHAAMANLTTPERLDRMAQRLEQRSAMRRARFERRAAATKALYAALSPGQQRAMDALPMLRGGRGHDGRGHGGWGKGRGMEHGMGGHAQG